MPDGRRFPEVAFSGGYDDFGRLAVGVLEDGEVRITAEHRLERSGGEPLGPVLMTGRGPALNAVLGRT